MQSNSQIDGVLAANDAMAVGAIEALDGANRKAQVIGINGTKEAIDAIKSGKLLASGDYNGFAQGCLGTMMAIRSAAQAAGHHRDRAEADRHHQGQLPALRRAARSTDLSDLGRGRQAGSEIGKRQLSFVTRWLVGMRRAGYLARKSLPRCGRLGAFALKLIMQAWRDNSGSIWLCSKLRGNIRSSNFARRALPIDSGSS